MSRSLFDEGTRYKKIEEEDEEEEEEEEEERGKEEEEKEEEEEEGEEEEEEEESDKACRVSFKFCFILLFDVFRFPFFPFSVCLFYYILLSILSFF